MRASGESLHQATGLRFGFSRSFGAELHHQPSAAFGQKREAFGVDPFRSRVADEKIVEAFEADGLVRHDFGHVIGALINVGISDDQQHALRRAFDQAASGFENRDAGAFGPDQGAGDVESILGQEIVQVVAGDAARNFGKTLADEIAVGSGDTLQSGVDFAAVAAPSSQDATEFFVGCRANLHAEAVVGEDFQSLDVVVGLAGHDRVHAAGVVADHAAESAAVVRGGIRREGEVVFFGGGAQTVEHDSGLYAGDAAGRIDFENPRHVFGKIEDDGDVAALSGERCASATAEQRRAELAAERDRGFDIVVIAREHDADRNLAVVGAVGRVESAGAAVEADFTADLYAQGLG